MGAAEFQTAMGVYFGDPKQVKAESNTEKLTALSALLLCHSSFRIFLPTPRDPSSLPTLKSSSRSPSPLKPTHNFLCPMFSHLPAVALHS